MSMPATKTVRWIITTVLALVVIGAGLVVFTHRKDGQSQDHICWDQPSSGTAPVKYLVTIDGGVPIETTIECVRIPPGLQNGEHIVVVRAVDQLGQMSPPATLKFVEP